MRLAHALIAKSIAETILVGSIAVVFYASTFPPTYHGWAEALPHEIAGWAVNQATAAERLQVQLFIDGSFVSTAIADQARPDVVAAGWAADEWHGYKFILPSLNAGPHEARVYALHESAAGKRQTLQLMGDPVKFVITSNGAAQSEAK
jgi:hypothetical protein